MYFLDGVVGADGPEDVTATKVADELLNPMGIEVIEDSIFVSSGTSSRSSPTRTATASTTRTRRSPSGPTVATSTSSPSA
ncbi:hypothetical protein NKG05_04250 [Oerskovia sp. M15]